MGMSDKKQDASQKDRDKAQQSDNGHDDVIHVARTPTNPALLTRLKHDRYARQARALGAGHTGSAIFHMQRLTALALIPLSIWFVIGVIRISMGGTHAQAAEWLSG